MDWFYFGVLSLLCGVIVCAVIGIIYNIYMIERINWIDDNYNRIRVEDLDEYLDLPPIREAFDNYKFEQNFDKLIEKVKARAKKLESATDHRSKTRD